MVSTALIYQVGILFLMLIPGIIMSKCGLSPPGLGKGLAACLTACTGNEETEQVSEEDGHRHDDHVARLTPSIKQ